MRKSSDFQFDLNQRTLLTKDYLYGYDYVTTAVIRNLTFDLHV